MITTFATSSAGIALTTGYYLELDRYGTNQVLIDLEGWYSPAPMRTTSTPRLWAPGSFSERGYRDERLISLTGQVSCLSRYDAAFMTDTLAATLADGEAGTFTVDDEDLGVRSAEVYLTGTPKVTWDGQRDIDFTVDMRAPDPRKYGPIVKTAPITASDPGGGLTFDLFATANANILDFGAVGVAGRDTLANAGSAESSPTFTVTGPISDGFTITAVDSGARLVYSGQLGLGEVLVLDSSDGSVMLNGAADRSSLLVRREWTDIPRHGKRTYLFDAPYSDWATLTIGAAPAWW